MGMNSNPRLGLAIAAILGGGSYTGLAHSAAENDADGPAGAIQEITVTAQRRTENMQNAGIHYANYVNNIPRYTNTINNGNSVANGINLVTYQGPGRLEERPGAVL
jgi:hypothetical protein